MSVILKPRSITPSGMAFAARPRSHLGLAALVTGGAILMALLLAATIPASAGSTAPTQVAVSGVIAD